MNRKSKKSESAIRELHAKLKHKKLSPSERADIHRQIREQREGLVHRKVPDGNASMQKTTFTAHGLRGLNSRRK